jgi:hypothetical protein
MVAPVDQTTRMYCSVADVTTRIDLSTLPGVNLDHLIRASTQRIETYCNRVFPRVPATGQETRHFLGTGSTVLSIDDLLDWHSVEVDDVAVSLTGLRQMPFGKSPSTWIEYESGATWAVGADVAIVGAWGYAEKLPWEIWDSCVALVVRALERAKTAYQDASAIPEMGQLVYAKAMPADIRDVLRRFRRSAL